MLSRSDDLDLANLVDDNDDDDEMEIELRRARHSVDDGGDAAHWDSTPSIACPSSSSSPSPSRPASPVLNVKHTESSRRQSDDRTQPHAQRRPSSPTAPLRERLNSVLSATTQVVSHLDTVADSVAEAMSLLQHPFGGSHHQQQQSRQEQKKERETYSIEPKLQEAKELQTRLKLQALWQLLLTGFEVLKFAIGKRARKRVLWLAVDGKLFLTPTKNDRNAAKYIFLADIYKVQKGSEAQSFTKSQSWRDARGSKEQLCFSIHGSSARREKTFALQVLATNVRNVVVENLLALLQRMKSDADGEFPYVAQRVIAQQYAATGDVIALHQVEDILLREEDEKKSGGGSSAAKEYSSDKKKGSRVASSRTATRIASASMPQDDDRSGGGVGSGGEDDDDDDNDDDRNAQRYNILG